MVHACAHIELRANTGYQVALPQLADEHPNSVILGIDVAQVTVSIQSSRDEDPFTRGVNEQAAIQQRYHPD